MFLHQKYFLEQNSEALPANKQEHQQIAKQWRCKDTQAAHCWGTKKANTVESEWKDSCIS